VRLHNKKVKKRPKMPRIRRKKREPLMIKKKRLAMVMPMQTNLLPKLQKKRPIHYSISQKAKLRQ